MIADAEVLPVADAPDVRRRLARLVRPHRGRLVLAAVLIAVASLAQAAIPFGVGRIIDQALAGTAAVSDVTWAVGLVSFFALAGAAGMYRAYVSLIDAGEAMVDDLRTEVFDHAVALPADVVEHVGTGQLVSRVTGDVGVIAAAVSSSVPRTVYASMATVTMVAAAASTDLRLFAIALVVGVWPGLIATRWYVTKAGPRYLAARSADADYQGVLHDHLLGRSALVGLDATDRATVEIDAAGTETRRTELSTADARNRLRIGLAATQAAALVTTVVAGLIFVDQGTATLGVVAAMALYVRQVIEPVSMLLTQLDEVNQTWAALVRVVGITSATDDLDALTPGITDTETHPSRGEVTLDSVTFGYVADRPVVHELDLVVPSGQHVVIVGASGAGKTTIANLVAAQRQPWNGVVTIDGVDVGAAGAPELRGLVAVIGQEPHVFGVSVRDNVALACPDPPGDDDVLAALSAVGADWVHQLPHGLDTVFGPDLALTAAQVQQLNLSRLILLDPAVIILDEATADLDLAAVAATDAALHRVLEGRTTITIAHRLTVATTADRILVLDDGRIVDDGHHEDLLTRPNSAYRRLWDTWQASLEA